MLSKELTVTDKWSTRVTAELISRGEDSTGYALREFTERLLEAVPDPSWSSAMIWRAARWLRRT